MNELINKPIYCEDNEEFIDRLIESKFCFSIDLKNSRMYVYSYKWREESDNDIGFHYHGDSQTYYTMINNLEDVEDIIAEAASVMKRYIKNQMATRLYKLINDHLE